jgi:hypothetical protein
MVATASTWPPASNPTRAVTLCRRSPDRGKTTKPSRFLTGPGTVVRHEVGHSRTHA